MPLVTRFEDLFAWQAARKLTQQVYRMCSEGPLSKDFDLRDQIQRAAVSVMANIAEGFDCESRDEFSRFLSYARRSAVEVQSPLYAAIDAGYIDQACFDALYEQANTAKAKIGGLKHSLKR